MAAPRCMNHEDRQSVLVATVLTTGDGVTLCSECVLPWAVSLIEAIANVPEAQLLDLIYGAQPPEATATELTPEQEQIVASAREAAANGDQTAVEFLESNGLALTTEGAPTDEPPPPAPADTDTDSTSAPPDEGGDELKPRRQAKAS